MHIAWAVLVTTLAFKPVIIFVFDHDLYCPLFALETNDVHKDYLKVNKVYDI